MPCCALAAFLLAQIVLGWDAAKRFALKRPSAQNDELRINPAAQWRLIPGPSAASEIAPPSFNPMKNVRRFPIRALAMAASLELLLASAAVYGIRLHRQHHHIALGSQMPICRVANSNFH